MDTDDPPSSSEDGPTDSEGASSPSLDTVFKLLANRRRRFTIYSLLDTPAGIITFDDLVENIAEWEANGTPAAEADDRRRAIASDLRDWHLVVLEEEGVVTYDDRSRVVQYNGTSVLEAWAERVRDCELSDTA